MPSCRRQCQAARDQLIKRLNLDDDYWARVDYLLAFSQPVLHVIHYFDKDTPSLEKAYDGIGGWLGMFWEWLERPPKLQEVDQDFKEF